MSPWLWDGVKQLPPYHPAVPPWVHTAGTSPARTESDVSEAPIAPRQPLGHLPDCVTGRARGNSVAETPAFANVYPEGQSSVGDDTSPTSLVSSNTA